MKKILPKKRKTSLEKKGSITYLRDVVLDGFKKKFNSSLDENEIECILSSFMMNVTVGLTEPNPFRDLVATDQACSIITMAHLRNTNKSIYLNLPHPLPFILETKDWKNHLHDDNDNTNTKKRKVPNNQI
jgi:hypothetical protein